MTSSLTPQVRPDKNGKLVTRHIKTDAAAGRTGLVMPAPTLAAPVKKVNREELINEVAEIVAAPPANPTRYTKTPSLKSVTSSLSEFKDEATIASIGDALNDPESSPFLHSLITSSFYYAEPNLEGFLKAAISVDRMYATIEHYGNQLPSALNSDVSNLFSQMGFKERDFKGEVTDEHIGYFQATLIANKLGIHERGFPVKNTYYRQIEMIRENMERIVPALPVLVRVMGRDVYKDKYADIENVLQYVDASGHAPKDIGDVMLERNTHDFALVKEVLDNGVRSMSSGVL